MDTSTQSTEVSDDTGSDNLSKSIVKKKLETSVYHLSTKTISEGKTSSKSSAWKHFLEILDSDGFTIKGFVACKTCSKVFTYGSKSTGTSALNRHSSTCTSIETVKSRKLQSFFPKTSADFVKHSTADKDIITQKCVQFISKDLRSFKTVSGKGFINLAQALINIGVERGRVNARDILPNPTTVSRQTATLASKLRIELVNEFKAVLNEIGGALTLDLWTDDYRKISYLCITCHYITSDWSLKDRVLCTVPWDTDEKKTGENVRKKIVSTLKTYGLDVFFQSLVYVTDRGTNIVNALRTVTRLNCTAHVLNNVLHSMFSECSETNIIEMVTAAKRLVQYFKQTGLQNRLQSTLKAQVETRWNSMFSMFESIHKNYDTILEILTERESEHYLNDLPIDAVSAISSFLLPFSDASEQLQVSKKPSLNVVVAWQIHLLKHLQIEEDEAEGIPALKRIGLRAMIDKYHLDIFHKVAFFLHPYTKALSALPDVTDIGVVHDKVRELVANLIQKESDTLSYTASPSTTQSSVSTLSIEVGLSQQQSTSQPQRKRKRFSLLDVADKLPDNTAKDDVDKYLDFIYNEPVHEDLDLLQWWKAHSQLFPYLSKVARLILSIPASSAPSERDFSTAGFVLQERRTQLNPTTVDDILFLHSNLN